jgi:SAM-dependent methyltransferase
MLVNDRVRMEAYRRAIHSAVRPGDVVLDVGGGSGVLTLFACQARAARVYCVERGDIIRLARELIGTNGCSDRVVFLPCDVADVELPERVDVIQSELIAQGLIGEQMAECIGVSRDRFLKPGGRLVPEQVSLWVAPIEHSDAHAAATLPPSNHYDIDFGCFQALSDNAPMPFRIAPEGLLAEGQIAYQYIAQSAPHFDLFDARLRFEPHRPGTIHGFVAWFAAQLAPGVVLDNAPSTSTCWAQLFLPLPDSVPVTPQHSIGMRLRGRDESRMAGLWSWETTIHAGGELTAAFAQSSFHGELRRPMPPGG